ncbi:MAG: hypothetical protein JNM93_05025 [Bacteriovoracaceae bacterium]|nr:hypothetical protein [Bacteriovoracaceae bacterium]
MKKFILCTIALILNCNVLYSQELSYDQESDAELLALITNIQVLDETLFKNTVDYNKGKLEEQWYLSHESSGERLNGILSAPSVYFSAHKQSSTMLTIDVAMIGLALMAQNYLMPNDDEMILSAGVSLAGISAVGSIAYSSPGFHNSIQSKEEKSIIHDTKVTYLNYARNYARNVSIIFSLTPIEEKLVTDWAFEISMHNFYQTNLFGLKKKYKTYDVLSFLKEKKIAMERVNIIQKFAANYKAFSQELEANAQRLKQQSEIEKKQKETFENKVKLMEELQNSIELRQREVTDPKAKRELDELSRKAKELKENYELNMGDLK